MIRHEYSRIAETMYEDRLENGLGVFVFSKPEFRKSYAFLPLDTVAWTHVFS